METKRSKLSCVVINKKHNVYCVALFGFAVKYISGKLTFEDIKKTNSKNL